MGKKNNYSKIYICGNRTTFTVQKYVFILRENKNK